jgi:steroid delta-isomerase
VPTAEGIQRAYEQYAAAWSRLDIDGVLALFAADAVVHDPVDGPALEGTEAIREYFSRGLGFVRAVRLASPVRISRDCRHAAACIEVEEDLGSQGIKVLEAIDVWSFDNDGMIATMNAYFGPTNLRDA